MSIASIGLLAPHAHVDKTGAKIGMWLFLFTEILLFMGMFLLYSVYRYLYPVEFQHAATHLNTLLGTINTIVLLTSSLTVVLAIVALERGRKNLCATYLFFTVFCGLIFMAIKYFEWGAKFEHHLYPGSDFMSAHPHGEIMFYGLYFMMTGLHGLHVLIGMGVLSWMLYLVVKNPYENKTFHPHQFHGVPHLRPAFLGPNDEKIWEGEMLHGDDVKQISLDIVYDDRVVEKINLSDKIKLENVGLYWHIVDIIWIFLFPLFYLIT